MADLLNILLSRFGISRFLMILFHLQLLRFVSLLLWHCIFASLFYPAGFCIPAALRAAGDVRYPMVISVASMLAFRVGLSFVFVRGFGLGVVSIWMAIFVDWGFRAVLFGLRFHSNIWQKKKLL